MNEQLKKRVLIIDDDPDILGLLSLKLGQQGYEVLTVTDGNAGLRELNDFMPDLVMVDINMPHMDGFKFCSLARRQSETYHFPIIVMTASDDIESVNRAYDCGASDFITKPINQAKLFHRLRFAIKASETTVRLSERERLLLSAQRTANMGEWTFDIDSKRFYCSPEAAGLFGIGIADNVDYESLLDLIDNNDVERVRTLFEEPTAKDKGYSLEYSITTADGVTKRICQTVDIDDTRQNGIRLLGVFQDITELREAESKVRTLSLYDGLTGLPNREFFKRMLARIIANANRYNSRFALIKVNIDNFMRINASLGHGAGDEVLREVSQRLSHCMRNSDVFSEDFSETNEANIMLGHMGADKFALVLNHIENYDSVMSYVQQIMAELNDNLLIAGNLLHLSTSIGISIFPDDATTADDMLMSASSALSQAKETGPNRHSYSFYSHELNNKTVQLLQIENQLAGALERDELQLYYQPKVSLVDNRICGAEVLLRWHQQELGFVSPDVFIPIAENKGLISSITDWIIADACRQLSKWQEQKLMLPSISINLEPSTLLQKDFNEHLFEQLQLASVDLTQLDFEITESTLMDNIDVVLPILEELKKLGSSISIDDFGTGYSSLGYLKSLPISQLKIDKSFISEVMHDNDDAIIVNAVISLAHNLGMQVIAEGVENSAQLDFLKERNCDVVQGYFYSKPLTADDFYEWCLQHNKSRKGNIELAS